jgi:major vault protein
MARDRDYYENDNQDLVVPPALFANLLNGTTGGVDVIVGPQSVSPAATDYPVVWNEDSGTFERCSKENALRQFYTAEEGQYVVLTNPSVNTPHPGEGARHKAVELSRGRKQNIPGPISFALWPGQQAEVVPGHHLRSNQYLLVRVYNDTQAMETWTQAVVKVNTDETTTVNDSETPTEPITVTGDVPQLHMGQLMVIRGTDVSFYIPPTGMEVVKDDTTGQYVRNAETLERLEFCILLSEGGDKRYVIGPDVVFPEPTETFVSQGNSRKGRALELNKISGIYVKVIEPYTDGGTFHKAGEELFITGGENALYYPRQEHSIIKYGDRVIHYATAIPAGEGRYVMSRIEGAVRIERGPSMFLPNPIEEVIVRRVLTDGECSLLYPGNHEVLQYNRGLSEAGRDQADQIPMASMALSEDVDTLSENYFRGGPQMTSIGGSPKSMAYAQSSSGGRNAAEEMIGSGIETTQRKRNHTRPRTLVLDTKFDGVVTVEVYNNYAALFTRKDGTRRVVVGPETVLLEYDEKPVAVHFSTGDEKSNHRTMQSAFLRVLNNRVSDEISVETSDGFTARLYVRYHLNFTGEDAKKWFDVENYVQFLCERTRSIIRREIKRRTVTDLKENAIDILRDTILGVKIEDGTRPGRYFHENSMHVLEMDVSTPVIDNDVEREMHRMEQEQLRRQLALKARQEELDHITAMEDLQRKILEANQATTDKRHELDQTSIAYEYQLKNARVAGDGESTRLKLVSDMDQQDFLDSIAEAERARREATTQLAIEERRAYAQIEIDKLKGQADAISPQLADAIRQLGDDKVVETLVHGLSPLSILGGDSVADIVKNMLAGTPVEGAMNALLERNQRDGARY